MRPLQAEQKNLVIANQREKHIVVNEKQQHQEIVCDTHSVSGVVSQRACVYCGARVVLNPITDAAHIVHGPIGCASYTWDIRGSLSSGSERYRMSYSTDLREQDIIFGGEKKLMGAIDEIIEKENPEVVFIYSTCVVGVIGDDVVAIAKKAEEKYNIRVIPVNSSGFSGSKKDGYKAACHAILSLMGTKESEDEKPLPYSLNYLGDFNLAGEAWIIRNYLETIGLNLVSVFTGDSSVKSLQQAKYASINVVQCAGSMTFLAKQMKERYGIPFEHVRFVGIEDTIRSLRKIVYSIGNSSHVQRFEALIEEKSKEYIPQVEAVKKRLTGKKVAIYVGGGFKAISLIEQFQDLGIETVLIGTQTGTKEEYDSLKTLTKEGTIILDDTNPTELEYFMKQTKADILVGGVKERPLAYKMGVAFIDHNHERKHPLAGFEGALNFALEVDQTVNSPVWNLVKGGK
jgi:nitrogenase molybdenum-cofactor synthesis protein NifE